MEKFVYIFRLEDGREVECEAERLTEAQQFVAGNYDGGDFARLLEIRDANGEPQ